MKDRRKNDHRHMDYLLHILVISGIYIIVSLGLNLIVGHTGLPSLGHGAFFCTGAYAASLVALDLGLSPWLGLLIGALLAGLFGLLTGILLARLRGDYFALATFGLAVVTFTVANSWASLTRGPMGLPGIPGFAILGYRLATIPEYLAVVAIFVALTHLVTVRMVDSPFGRVLRAIREDEIATVAMGKDVTKHRIQVFVAGALFAGVAGGLYAYYFTFIDPSSFTAMESITVLLMVVLGGMGSVAGPFVGAVILVVLPEFLRLLGMPGSVAAPLRQMLYGLLLVALMLGRPQGILGTYKFK